MDTIVSESWTVVFLHSHNPFSLDDPIQHNRGTYLRELWLITVSIISMMQCILVPRYKKYLQEKGSDM